MAGTDVGCDYLLYRDGEYTGQTVSGTGSAVSFGTYNVPGVYTCVESNVTTGVTRTVPGTAVISYATTPTVTVQPQSVTAGTNSVAVFSLSAQGVGLTYQWYRNGMALTDDGHFWGTTTTQLMINPVLPSDAATTSDGYYCMIVDACGQFVYSVTNALTIQPPRPLVWIGSPTNIWDIANTVNWSNTAAGTMTAFNQGDDVVLDDRAQSTSVLLASPYISPSTITFNASGTMGIGSVPGISPAGNIYGPNTRLIVNGVTPSAGLSSRMITVLVVGRLSTMDG